MIVKKKKAVVYLIIAALAAMTITGVAVLKSRPQPKQLKILPDKVDLQIKDVHYTDVAESGMKWEINAATARFVKKDETAFFDKVKVKLTMPEGRSYVLTGDRGFLKTDSKDMTVSGNVNIVSDDGDHLWMDDLAYSNQEKTFHTDNSVVLENPGIRLSGKGMTLWIEEKKLALSADVKARIVRVGK